MPAEAHSCLQVVVWLGRLLVVFRLAVRVETVLVHEALFFAVLSRVVAGQSLFLRIQVFLFWVEAEVGRACVVVVLRRVVVLGVEVVCRPQPVGGRELGVGLH